VDDSLAKTVIGIIGFGAYYLVVAAKSLNTEGIVALE